MPPTKKTKSIRRKPKQTKHSQENELLFNVDEERYPVRTG